ncbi:MAG TPA: START-like domain-containing protein [Bacteroidia bacterium]|jgi:hypothetical protein|nr:START-like domain-containing protein [Bacteroidia bacterium]
MSKKISKKTIKKVVSKKKAGNSKTSKSVAKKSKVVKKIAPKKAKAAKKVVVKKKVVAKKIAKPVAKKKAAKPAKKVQPKKTTPVKKVAKPVVKAKAVVVKKVKAEKPVKVAKPSKVAVTKSVSTNNSKTIFQPARKNTVEKTEKHIPDPPGKYELEYIIHTSTPILFEFLTTPSGLSEWFCDDVNIRDNVYSFQWDENLQYARLIKYIEESVVRYQWLDKTDNSYFEFRIERDDLTNDISLIVADFADTLEDKHSSTLLWNSQIDKLLSVLGSH